jgi:hypothetical protein
MAIVWKTYDKDAVKADEKSVSSKQKQFLKWKVGTTKIRIFPSFWQPEYDVMGKEGSPFLKVPSHFISHGDTKINITCPRATKDEFCPVCAIYQAKSNSLNPRDKEDAKDFRINWNYYANAIDTENPELGPQIIRVPKTLMEQLVELVKNDEFGDYSHPETGYILSVKKKIKENKFPEYSVLPSLSPSPLSDWEEYFAEDQLVNLVDYYTPNNQPKFDKVQETLQLMEPELALQLPSGDVIDVG